MRGENPATPLSLWGKASLARRPLQKSTKYSSECRCALRRTHTAHALAGALLKRRLNHPAWALSVNRRFPAGAGAQSAGRCCFPGEELEVPRARECWRSWMELQCFRHKVSPRPPAPRAGTSCCLLCAWLRFQREC